MAGRVGMYLQCPTCLDIFKDPVVLSCGHSFCRMCLQQWKDTGNRSCPVCRTQMSSLYPPPNLALRNVCRHFSPVLVNLEDLCSLHQEELRFFCSDHQELVCLFCKDEEIHVGHKFSPLEEVANGHKEKLQEGLQDTKRRLQNCIRVRDKCNEQAKYIKVQREKVKSKIKKDFEELRHFLDIEEDARLSAVMDEEKKKSLTMKEKITALSREMTALSNTIRSTEELLKSDNVSIMKNLQTAMSRIQELPDEPQLIEGALLDEAKHVGNLKFNVWQRMKETFSYSPVILDPNTAHPKLSLSDDLTSLTHKEAQWRPENPERAAFPDVLGCALDSGRHVWDVEVGDNTHWVLGVAWGELCFQGQRSHCCLGFRDGKYQKLAVLKGSWNLSVKVQRIRIDVDMNERSISISESLTNTVLWTTKNSSDWPDLSGHTKMYPYFYTSCKNPLKIIPFPPRIIISMSLC
nr:E3 ubiquitin-protein ligase TRIM35-like [Nerophis lumbriciformis]